VAVKIKLKRLGKIREPYYRIVVADARTKRDGRAIEEIGKYHPKAEPSFIEVDSERAQYWLSVGAQPTDPVRVLLKVTGDWQKFTGEPGSEGTLRTAAPRGLLWVTTAAIYLQILLGATVRHTGAGLVCVDLPYCRGALWPTGVHPMVHLHMAHRAFAFVVLALVCWSALRIARASRGLVRALAWTGPALVVVQIALGVITILTFKDLVPLTAHLLAGALLLADFVALLALTRHAPALESSPAAVGVAA